MVSNAELKELIRTARKKGVLVVCFYDELARKMEGRAIIESIQILNIKGVRTVPMGPLAAAEKLRSLIYTKKIK